MYASHDYNRRLFAYGPGSTPGACINFCMILLDLLPPVLPFISTYNIWTQYDILNMQSQNA